MNQHEQKIFDFFQEKGIRLGDAEGDILTCNYVEQGLLDSLGIVDFVVFLETSFEIQFSPEEMGSEELFSIVSAASLVGKLSSTEPHERAA